MKNSDTRRQTETTDSVTLKRSWSPPALTELEVDMLAIEGALGGGIDGMGGETGDS
ncbi:MAG: hypothetical protein AAFX04_11410 [Pseudomonadota bacterium]